MASDKPWPDTIKRKLEYFFNPTGADPDVDDMVHIFSLLFDDNPRAIFVLDGLDEVVLPGASTVLSTLHKLLQRTKQQKVFVACRDELDLNIRPNFAAQIQTSSSDTKKDIDLYIDLEISRKMQQERRLTENAHVLSQIKSRLAEEARGM